MGVPIMAIEGATHQSRVTYSILKNLDLTELSSSTIEGYINKTNDLKLRYPNNIKIWNLSSFNSSKTKKEILDFISYGNNRTIEKEFKRNTKLKSQRELILKKIKEWFSV